MKDIILSSDNPLMIKSLYGVLRDEGYNVEMVEHPALAVQKILRGKYDLIIVDSEPFGLSAEDAVQIIKTLVPDMPVLIVGRGRIKQYETTVETPLDLEDFKRMVHSYAV
jgi:DNA-binding NtrC family response regulator